MFHANTAGKKGGAVVMASTSMVEVNDTAFINNMALGSDGGAFNVGKNAKLTIHSGNFTFNYALGNGGALSASSYSAVEILNGTFGKNTADEVRGTLTLEYISRESLSRVS
ncbi:unnamed protein product, partial [Discosporangium mesarthrocarpum]